MAILQNLKLHGLRHFEYFELFPSPNLNFISGSNGAGKTSILEAIYMLSYGRSFRSPLQDVVIQDGKDQMVVVAEVHGDKSSSATQKISKLLGLQKNRTQKAIYQINNQPIEYISKLSESLPTILMTTQSTRYFTDGPKLRRDFLSWGLFYTVPGYFELWQQNKRALMQRNKLLRMFAVEEELESWTHLLANTGEAIDKKYLDYIQQLKAPFSAYVQRFLPEMNLNLQYKSGWDKAIGLQESLDMALEKSKILGYTHIGIHRCDLQVLVGDMPCHLVLSRGQLKLVHFALALSQGIILQQHIGQTPIYLIDDLSAELDTNKQELVLNALLELESQIFMTSIAPLNQYKSSAWYPEAEQIDLAKQCTFDV